jgi:hypothetical protein
LRIEDIVTFPDQRSAVGAKPKFKLRHGLDQGRLTESVN